MNGTFRIFFQSPEFNKIATKHVKIVEGEKKVAHFCEQEGMWTYSNSILTCLIESDRGKWHTVISGTIINNIFWSGLITNSESSDSNACNCARHKSMRFIGKLIEGDNAYEGPYMRTGNETNVDGKLLQELERICTFPRAQAPAFMPHNQDFLKLLENSNIWMQNRMGRL